MRRLHKVVLVGSVSSIPHCTRRSCRFQFSIKQLNGKHYHGNLLLTWYGIVPMLEIGQIWRLSAHLSSHHKYKHYQYWMWSKNIVSTGYVGHATKLISPPGKRVGITLFRQNLENFIKHSVRRHDLAAVLSALTVGSRSLMSRSVWRVFQRTGTSHLVAISGLHIGIVAAAVYRLSKYFCCRMPWLVIRVPAQLIAVPISLVAALLYSLLAGLSLPTQRALVMLGAYYFPQLYYIHTPVWRRMSIAFILIVSLDPGAILQVGFWLSFGAVFFIAYMLRARLGKIGRYREWARVHIAVTIGLIPMTLFFFHKVSLVSPVANFLAVPWMTVLVVPIALAASVMCFFYTALSAKLFQLAALVLWPLWAFLNYLSGIFWASWAHVPINNFSFFLASYGVILMLSPLTWEWKLLGGIYCVLILY